MPAAFATVSDVTALISSLRIRAGVNTQAFAASPVLAAKQVALFALAAAQLLFVPPAFTAHVPAAEANCKFAVLTNVWSSAEVTLIVVTLVPVRAVVNVPVATGPDSSNSSLTSCVTTASCAAVGVAELMVNVHVLYPFACVTATPLLVAAIACDELILMVQRSSPAH